jgi:hypothetical protein
MLFTSDHRQIRKILTISLLWFVAAPAQGGRYNDLAAWAAHDSDNYAQFVGDLNKARNARDVALALKENGRRQRKTMDELIRFVHAQPELRDAAQLGFDPEGQQVWEQQHRDRQMRLPPDVVAIQQQMHRRNSMVDAQGGKEMVSVLRKYNQDPEVMRAAEELGQTMAENRRKLLEALR